MFFASSINTLLDFMMLLTFACFMLPSTALFSFNPLIAWAIAFTERILGALRSAIPLPRRGLLLFLFLLLLSVKAAFLFRQPMLADLVLGNTISLHFAEAGSFLRWVGVALIHVGFFWVSFALSVVLLRLWNRNGTFPYPGRIGGMLLFLSRPFSERPPAIALPALMFLLAGLALLGFSFAEEAVFINYFDYITTNQTTKATLVWDPDSAAFALNNLFVALTAFTAVPAMLLRLMLLFIVLSFAALLSKRGDWATIAHEGIAALMGRSAGSSMLQLGGVNIGPILFIFAMNILINAINIASGALYTKLQVGA